MGITFTSWDIEELAPESADDQEQFVRDQANEVAVIYVAVYDVTREFGGPEEGGWWYDSGTLIDVRTTTNMDEAKRLKDELAEDYPMTKCRYSVLGGEDYDINITPDFPAAFFPAERPHYE